MVYALLAGRWALAVILIAAGLAKLRAHSHDDLEAAAAAYGVLPGWLVAPAAAMLPWAELTLGVLLGVGVLIVPAATLAAALLLTFATVVGWHVSRGNRFPCGCGTEERISYGLVARDLLLSGIAVAVAFGPSAGLAAWPGWGSSTVSASFLALLPVPLIVLLAAVWVRAYLVIRAATRTHIAMRHVSRND